ncbi:MAG TPA: hypothetical protein VH593_01285 [Ktedonobacteraceae bacterium]
MQENKTDQGDEERSHVKRRFSEMYCQFCQAVEASIQEKLGRPLTQREQSSIWNTGSLLLLEAYERAVFAAQSPEEATLLLSQQAALAEDGLQRAKEQMLHKLKELLVARWSPHRNE